MQTVQQWANKIHSDPHEFFHWLSRQYIGEALAAERIEALAEANQSTKFSKTLHRIASDELKHRDWIGGLLKTRGIALPDPTYEGTRYWKETLIDNPQWDFKQLAAIGHHAETMRLARIEAIANDPRFPNDVREVFFQIFDDETFHAAAFKAMTDEGSIQEMQAYHEAGMAALGLEI